MLPSLPLHIEHIDFSGSTFGLSEDQSEELPVEITTLKTLRLNKVHKFPVEWLHGLILASQGSIECLDIGWCHNVAKVDIRSLITQRLLPNVKDLSFEGLQFVDDDLIQEVLNAASMLERINLSHTNQVTGVAIKALVLAKVRKLGLIFAEGVSKDAVDYAREKGILVDFAFPDERSRVKHARKIRD